MIDANRDAGLGGAEQPMPSVGSDNLKPVDRGFRALHRIGSLDRFGEALLIDQNRLDPHARDVPDGVDCVQILRISHGQEEQVAATLDRQDLISPAHVLRHLVNGVGFG